MAGAFLSANAAAGRRVFSIGRRDVYNSSPSMSYPPDDSPPPLSPQWAQPLNYSSSAVQRPSIVTAIGVASIIIAAVSIPVNLLLAGVVMILSKTPAAALVAQIHAPAPVSVPTATPYVPPNGLSDADRQMILEALGSIRPLNPERLRQLDGFLA